MVATLIAALFLSAPAPDTLRQAFLSPPDSARPWVYWYFMDGNLTREGMTADLEAMKRAGIGGALYLEVGLGIPRGPVEFMSLKWRELVGHAFAEADRLGIEMGIGSGPGWCGTGGPWVKPEQSMQHLVASETAATGPAKFDAVLPRPQPRTPFFGEGTLTPELHKAWKEFYRDVVVLAFPTPAGDARIADVDEKALFFRAPYSSQPGVKPYLTSPVAPRPVPADQCVDSNQIVDLTDTLTHDGRLTWDVPPGNWTIMRFGRTITGQTTRPAPEPGLGLESDKFDPKALDTHFDAFIETLLKQTGEPKGHGRGLTTLHFDSWEMSSQNWSAGFRDEFARRRGYDPLKMLPTMIGHVVDGSEKSERFLWDLRQTAQELVVENHAKHLKALGRRHGLRLTIEPYDLDPCSDLELGGAADVPGCEFWSKGYGYDTSFSVIEATSIAHTMGRPVVWAEAFTAAPGEYWHQYPGSMKEQGDWALCAGINRFAFHRYQAQPWLDRFPGMTMGPYGVFWERTQTWWDLVAPYHLYLTRCQEMLRRGRFVADVLYLAPEGAPNVFLPPRSALQGDLPDRRGYNFDGCAPSALMARASVKNGSVVFPDGMSYRLLVLPRFDSMTPQLLRKVVDLVKAGATVVGRPVLRSPSLAGYPQCDEEVRRLSAELWGAGKPEAERKVGKGRAVFDAEGASAGENPLADAKWIWTDEGDPASSAPVGRRYFAKIVTVEPGRAIRTARVLMTADNRFELLVNGRPSAAGSDFHRVQTAEVGALLKPGENSIEVTVENEGEAPNPAGLIGALEITFEDGSRQVVPTDRTWSALRDPRGASEKAKELGNASMWPWNLSTAVVDDLYAPYEATARVLARMAVRPDFETAGDVRYIHRRDGGTDLYFVAGRLSRAQSATCRFRVSGKQPEWWNPVTGESRDLPDFIVRDGITSVPLHLEPLESGFVVFRRPIGKRVAGRNDALPRDFAAVNGPWRVAFDPRRGGPASVRLASLQDWSKRPEPGIKYYSGQAVYRAAFDCALPTGQTFLSIGKVRNLASVKLNGRDLGVLWCAPWRVAIPPGLLRAKRNELEITVANLWINRLIGDSALPQEKRVTWTTNNPYSPSSPLQDSGLLGPVTLQRTP